MIEFDTLTSIIGENDQGKSNVYRALEMVLLHKPFSESQLRYGTKSGSVKVMFTDGTWIERTRDGSKQTCTLFDGHAAFTYNTIKDIGEVVINFTGFRPVMVDKNSRPESVQLIPIDAGQTFLITGISPDGVMRRINRLMAGSGVETARIALEKELRSIEKTNEVQEAAMREQEAVVEALNAPIWSELEGDRKRLNELLEEHQSVTCQLDALLRAEGLAKDAVHVENAVEEFSGAPDQMIALSSRLESIKSGVGLVTLLMNSERTLKSLLEALDAWYAKDDEVQDSYEEAKHQYHEAAKQYELAKQAAEMEKTKVCPTCKRPL